MAADERDSELESLQQHGDRLSSLDAAFLEMESPDLHMHVGGLFVFDPPEGDRRFRFPRFLELVESRLHLLPRYRQRLVHPPMQLANAVWADDPHFDLAYHVRHAALPEPGTTAQLTEYCARILSRQLDRDRPLWELYVIEGLEGGRIAMLGKTHHAMVDGIAGLDIATVMLDLTPDQSDEVSPPQPWEPHPTPSSRELVVDAVRDLAGSPAEFVGSVRRAINAPRNAARRAVSVGMGVVKVARSNLVRPAPRSLLNQPPGPHRRFAIQRVDLERVKAIKDAFQTTVNDAVLALVADATGRHLRYREVRTDGLWLRAMVPVSTRSRSESHHLGNRVVSVFVDLPMWEMDPVERLRICQDAMREVRASHAAVGADFLIGLGDFAPPTIHAMAARLAVNSRLYNFLVSNVPGPQAPIYCMGARLLGAFPFAPLAANHSYAVGVTSMDGSMNFGFTVGYDAFPDIERVTGFLLDALADLTAAAGAVNRSASPSDGPRPGRDADESSEVGSEEAAPDAVADGESSAGLPGSGAAGP